MSDFNFGAFIASGHRFVSNGGEWHVTTPEGRHGFGPSAEEALLNIGATIVSTEFGRRLIRENGDAIYLDVARVPDDVPRVVLAPPPEIGVDDSQVMTSAVSDVGDDVEAE